MKQIFKKEKKKDSEQNLRQKMNIWSKLLNLHQCCEVSGCATENCYISSGVDCKLLVSLDQKVFLV